jgi:predicted Zn-dependent protease
VIKAKISKVITWFGLLIITSTLVTVIRSSNVKSAPAFPSSSLPPLQVCPLPPKLAQWQEGKDVGDYFDRIQTTSLGYLIWTKFPIAVYLEKPGNNSEKWLEIVRQGMQEWSVYLPLQEIDEKEKADIIIDRSPPPLDAKINPKTGLFDIPPARSAQTRYEFYLSQDNPSILNYRMTIKLSPGQNDRAILSAIRHEMGHALGIWGHSPFPTDALYFSQVRDSPPISPRDINTLKKIYQQPTRFGLKVQ